MQILEAHRVEPGWEVVARDGSAVGTVTAAGDEDIIVRPYETSAEPVTVPAHLVVEAHDERVFVDMGPQEFGLSRSTGDVSPQAKGPAVPQKELKIEDVRRVTGG